MLIRNSRLATSLCQQSRNFSTILSTGEKVEREMTPLEREIVNVKESQFSKLGLFKKNVTNEASLYKLFQMAQSGNKSDYSACIYAINHFYNFGVHISHYDFTNRWLAMAVETGRVDEAVSIVKLWNTWLPCPPRIEYVESLMGMVKVEQSRELLKAIRENWQMPLSARAYTIVIAKQLAKGEDTLIKDALQIWRDAVSMGVVLPIELGESLLSRFKDTDPDVCAEIRETLIRWSPGGYLATI
jgi:hypothetical protein